MTPRVARCFRPEGTKRAFTPYVFGPKGQRRAEGARTAGVKALSHRRCDYTPRSGDAFIPVRRALLPRSTTAGLPTPVLPSWLADNKHHYAKRCTASRVRRKSSSNMPGRASLCQKNLTMEADSARAKARADALAGAISTTMPKLHRGPKGRDTVRHHAIFAEGENSRPRRIRVAADAYQPSSPPF